MKNFLPLTRKFHIYFGLLISPFILIYSLSVLAYNHAGITNKISPVKTLPVIRTKLAGIPYDTTDLLTAKAVIRKLGIKGEIDFIIKNDEKISFPVNKPGLMTNVEINRHTDSVIITSHRTGSVGAVNFLHIMPGQHNVNNRGNSIFIKVWRLIADGVVYLLLFLVLSGILMWHYIDYERVTGYYTLILGTLFFAGLLLLLFKN